MRREGGRSLSLFISYPRNPVFIIIVMYLCFTNHCITPITRRLSNNSSQHKLILSIKLKIQHFLFSKTDCHQEVFHLSCCKSSAYFRILMSKKEKIDNRQRIEKPDDFLDIGYNNMYELFIGQALAFLFMLFYISLATNHTQCTGIARISFLT